MLTLTAIGMNYRHPENFRIERPNGSGNMLLLIFKTAAQVVLGGEKITVRPDSALLYNCDTPQLYMASGGVYIDHWLHFETDEKCPVTDICGFPADRPVKLSGTAEAENIMQMIIREQLSALPSRDLNLDLMLRLLLSKLSEATLTDTLAASQPYSETLSRLRAEIYSNAGRFSSVAQLASRANLSSSYFQRLYTKQFGVSCYEDLLTAKIRTAEYYLLSTDLTIREIAENCGYENDVVFMRLFRKRTGMKPGEYRRSGG